MNRRVVAVFVTGVCASVAAVMYAEQQASPLVEITGELRQWHKVTVTLNGPVGDERAASPNNPFTDVRMTVTFVHESGAPRYDVPGYFAGDGNAAETSATTGTKWRAHFSPDKSGTWRWRVGFVTGNDIALAPRSPGQALAPFDGLSGQLTVQSTNKVAPDFRAAGRLQYVSARYLRFAGNGQYFLKAGSDSPETLLAFADFDETAAGRSILHTYGPHLSDWREGDPVWKGSRGKGLIGAINYLASQGVNAMSFLTYNAGGDGDNVWPFASRGDKRHYDVSKLDQWQIVFDHAQSRGIYLHFKLQETEIDDNVRGNPFQPAGRGGRGARGTPAAGSPTEPAPVVEALDGGALGPERRLYLRELVARFGYALALNWNLGEENTQTPAQQRAMAQYLRDIDPYDHHIVLHTYPDAQDAVYEPLLGQPGVITGVSLQNPHDTAHERTLRWVRASEAAGVPWVTANDEQNTADLGVPPDPGYGGFNGRDSNGNQIRTIHDIRRYTLWGNLMAGGAGVEYYAGYSLPENDLVLENFRSRERSWRYAALALRFFHQERIPFWEMRNDDALVGNPVHDNRVYCFARRGEVYLVFLPTGGSADLDLRDISGNFAVSWFDPRSGGALKAGTQTRVSGGRVASLGRPPAETDEDWLVVVRRVGTTP
jgi:hypothetical protein